MWTSIVSPQGKSVPNYVTAFETAENRVNLLQAFTNFQSLNTSQYIDECETFEAAFQKLDSVLMTRPRTVFAHRLLATAKHKPGKSLDKFLQELRRFSNDCNFQAVAKKQHCNGFLRDEFTNGIFYTTFKPAAVQRVTLTIDRAFEKAPSIKNSEAFVSTEASAWVTASSHNSEILSTHSVSVVSNRAFACFFCGRKIQNNRKKCPTPHVYHQV